MEKTGLKLTDLDDQALVARALHDSSQAAYLILYDRYHDSVRGHIARFVGNQDDIDDICIESFAKAFKQLSSYKSENRFSTWIFTIARNTALDHLDKEKVRGKKLEITAIGDPDTESSRVPDDTRSPEEEIISSQDHENFLSCIGGLPDLYREIASLCFIDNLGYKEISEKTDLPLNTVKTRVRRAKELIVRMMQDLDD